MAMPAANENKILGNGLLVVHRFSRSFYIYRGVSTRWATLVEDSQSLACMFGEHLSMTAHRSAKVTIAVS